MSCCFLKRSHWTVQRPASILVVDSCDYRILVHVSQPAAFLATASGEQLFEVQKVEGEGASRSWFVSQEVVSDGSLHVITPFDPLFLLAAYLSPIAAHYVPYSDMWEAAVQAQLATSRSTADLGARAFAGERTNASLAEDMLEFSALSVVRKRVAEACETQDHAGVTLYRFSVPLVLHALRVKVDDLTNADTGIFGPTESSDLAGTEASGSVDSQPSAEVLASEKGLGFEHDAGLKPFPTLSYSLGREGVGNGHGLSQAIQLETRQKVAIGLFCNYLTSTFAASLAELYPCQNLNAHLASLQASSVLSTTYLPGRSSDGPVGGGNAAAALKAKKTASRGSLGVEALKKVSTTGMRKLDSFFKMLPDAETKKKQGVKRKV